MGDYNYMDKDIRSGDCGRDRLVMQRCQGDFRESYQGTILIDANLNAAQEGSYWEIEEHEHNSSLLFLQRKLPTFI